MKYHVAAIFCYKLHDVAVRSKTSIKIIVSINYEFCGKFLAKRYRDDAQDSGEIYCGTRTTKVVKMTDL